MRVKLRLRIIISPWRWTNSLGRFLDALRENQAIKVSQLNIGSIILFTLVPLRLSFLILGVMFVIFDLNISPK